ncbi:hypothetical protein BD769DRAFT_1673788 [Suillus cothurnatus]|nr:hypothetical protein BD769DRAFT_1673788 [Suillus cothurnatus]
MQQSLHFKRASEVMQGAPAAKKIKLGISIAETTIEDAITSWSDVPAQATSMPAATSAASGSSGYTLPGPSTITSQTYQSLPPLQPSTELWECSLLDEQPQAEPSMATIPTPEGIHPTCSRRLPMRFCDEPPVPPPPIPQSPPSTLPRVILHVFDSFRTSLNQFGIGREYRHHPTHDPDAFVSVNQLSNFYPNSSVPSSSNCEAISSLKGPPWPWRNMSVWRLMTWMLTGSNQSSEAQTTRLVKEVILAEDFEIKDMKGFNAHTEMRRLDSSEAKLDVNDIY